jgi:hypothetical protein
MCVGIVTSTWICVGHRAWLLHKVNLKADNKFCPASMLPWNWYHGKKIHEGLSASTIIDQTDLCFLLGLAHGLQIVNGIVINISTLNAWLDFAIRGLEKPAVSAKDHVLAVSRQSLKILGAVNNRHIIFVDIAHDERAGQVDRANVNLRIGSSCHTHLDLLAHVHVIKLPCEDIPAHLAYQNQWQNMHF